MPAAATGDRVRERRRVLGVTQADLARGVGISASYLNLIEHGRRQVAPPLLARLAAVLGVAPEVLSAGAGAMLAADLRDAAAGSGGTPPEVDRIEEFTARFPGWAGLAAAQHRRIGQLERAVAALSDRLAHDPHLSAALHEVLSAATAVRSTAAILAETEDIAPDWRQRFHANLHADSERLAVGAEALAAYLDAEDAALDRGASAPLDEVEAWFAAEGWHLPGLEPDAPAEAGAALAAGAAQLASEAARRLARDWLATFRADAAALPVAPLAAALAAGEADPARLAATYRADVIAVLRRLALLPGVAAGLVICDASGTPVLRKPVEGFDLPRFGAACPLWPLYTALARPGTPVAAAVETPGRIPRRFRALGWCSLGYPGGFSGPAVARAAMLVLPLPAGAAGPALPVGTSCRICPRGGCAARREPSIMAEDA
jgi:hypothetical protein